MAAVQRARRTEETSRGHAQPGADEGMMAALVRMAEAAGAPPTRLMRDFAALSFGPGRVSFADYERLRLYDEIFWGESDRRAVVGRRRARELALLANFRHDWLGLAHNRLALFAYLSAHGLPVAAAEAIYAPGLATPSPKVLRTREELRQFLNGRAGRGLVARPVEHGAPRRIGPAAPGDLVLQIDRIVEDVGDTPGAGWLIEPVIAPHPQIGALFGDRLAPVRLLTLAGEHGPRVFRAIWTPPGRAGVLAQLDPSTGKVLRLVRGFGPELAEVRAPSVGLPAGDLKIPAWSALKALVCEAARTLPLGFLGWDVAATATGPMIVGMTAVPDVSLCQLADRRGLLDGEFLAFLDARRSLAAEHAHEAKAFAEG